MSSVLFPPSFHILSFLPLSLLHSFSLPSSMLMHARSATVLAALRSLLRSSRFPLRLFVYLAKFDSPTRSDLTSRSLLVLQLLFLSFAGSSRSSNSLSTSSFRPFISCLASSGSSSSSLSSSPSPSSSSSLHRRRVFLSTPFQLAALTSPTAFDSVHRIRSSLFGGRLAQFFSLLPPSIATVYRPVISRNFPGCTHTSILPPRKASLRVLALTPIDHRLVVMNERLCRK